LVEHETYTKDLPAAQRDCKRMTWRDSDPKKDFAVLPLSRPNGMAVTGLSLRGAYWRFHHLHSFGIE
jgi:hypothetical protein